MVNHADRQTVAEVLREFHGIVISLDESVPRGVIIKTMVPKGAAILSASGGSVVVDLENWELSTATFDALIVNRTLPGGGKP